MIISERYYVMKISSDGLVLKKLFCWDLKVQRNVVIKTPIEHNEEKCHIVDPSCDQFVDQQDFRGVSANATEIPDDSETYLGVNECLRNLRTCLGDMIHGRFQNRYRYN